MTVTLPIEQWNQVLAVLSQAPWNQVNPLIMAIGEQLRQQGPRPNGTGEPLDVAPTTNRQ